MAKLKLDMKKICEQIEENVKTGIVEMEMPEFVPTGAMEPAAIYVGTKAEKGKTTIINLQCANKLGKTTMGAVIFRNILWEYDKKYFNYPAYRTWPFTEDVYDENGNFVKTGPTIKRFRIVGTAENTSDTGPIKAEIKKWWPKGRYKVNKGGKHYDKNYITDTGWHGDILTFEQDPKEFEGPMESIQWIDEPAKATLMGAITSRFSQGGILLITQTPIGAGPMIDILDDLKEKGAEIITITASLYDNSVTSGKLNSKGTKRGLMTDDGIQNYISTIPLDQRDARVFGKNIGKSGKIYPKFSDVHVRWHDLDSSMAKKWNCYCVMDPHDKYYPFISWWAISEPDVTGRSQYICYNEWPTVKTLSGYYDEKRKSVECNLTPKEISEIINLLDGTQYGLNIMGRVIDPRFARNSKSDFSKKTEGIVIEYQKHGILWSLPPNQKIDAQRDHIRELMNYNENLGVNQYNEPQFYVMPHCTNTRRSFQRHYWIEGEESEAEQYKDPVDNARMFFAYIQDKPWRMPIPHRPVEREMILPEEDIFEDVLGKAREIALK